MVGSAAIVVHCWADLQSVHGCVAMTVPTEVEGGLENGHVHAADCSVADLVEKRQQRHEHCCHRNLNIIIISRRLSHTMDDYTFRF